MRKNKCLAAIYYNYIKVKQPWFVNGLIVGKSPLYISDPPSNSIAGTISLLAELN